jgi:ABC-type glycerol-3-phosphate transport system substrate-binding protein
MTAMSKRINRRAFLQSASILAAGSALAACAPAPAVQPIATQAEAAPTAAPANPEGVKIAWWNQFNTPTCQEWFPKIVKTFEDENPGIKVEFEITGGPPGGGNYTELLLARIAAGNPPDTCTLWDPPSGYGARGALDTIDDLMAGAATAKADAFYSGVLKSCQFKGKTFGLPASAGVGCIFVNKQMLEDKGISTKSEDLPKTWNELSELSAKMTSYKGSDLDIVGMTPWDTNVMLTSWSQLNGGMIFDAGTLSYKIDSTQNTEWFQFWLDWLEKQFKGDLEKLNIVANAGDVYPNSTFQLGKTAIATSGAWACTDAGIPFKWELFAAPVGPSGSGQKNFYWPNWFAMPKGGPHPQEAFKFVEHMTTKGWAVWYENATIDTPAWTGVSADIVNKALEKQEGRERAVELQNTFADMLKNTSDVWTSPVESFATDTLASAVGELLNKKSAPAEALANAQKVIQAKLDETMKNG